MVPADLHFLLAKIEPLFAASWESIIVIIVLTLGSALMNWLKKRGEETDWTDVERPHRSDTPSHRTWENPPAPPPRRDLSHWEEELRRMLEMEKPSVPPAPAPPPIIIRESTSPTPPVYRVEPAAPHTEVYTETIPEEVEPQLATPQTLTEANIAYERARQLQEQVTTHLAEAHQHRLKQVSRNVRTVRSNEANQVILLLRHPRTARQAIIASVILAPPKALEINPSV